jgi:hypothetical protein
MFDLTRAVFGATIAALGVSASFLSQIPFAEPHFTSLEGVVTHESHPEHSLTFTRHNVSEVSTAGEGSSLTDVCPGATSGYTGKPPKTC